MRSIRSGRLSQVGVGFVIFDRAGLGVAPSLKAPAQGRVGEGQDLGREESRVLRAPDRDRGDGNAPGHLHDRQQRVEPAGHLGRDWDADDRQDRLCRHDSRQVCGPPGSGDEDADAALFSLADEM